MKRHNPIIALALLVTLASGCRDQAYLHIDSGRAAGTETVSLSEAGMEIGHAGGEVAIPLSTNVKYSLEIPGETAWISDRGTGNASEGAFHTLFVEKNRSSEDRYAEIVFRHGETGMARSFYIRQAGRFPTLVFVFNGKVCPLPDLAGEDLTATVDWGDGSQESCKTGMHHEYGEEGPYTVTVTGRHLDGFSFDKMTGIVSVDASGL